MAAGAVSEVRIDGLRELQNSLAKINRNAAREVREALIDAADPVRVTAESYAFGSIRNIGNIWGEMRLGVTRTGVYMVPRTRNSGFPKRPNLGRLLMEEAMIPAVESHQGDIAHNVKRAFDNLVLSTSFH